MNENLVVGGYGGGEDDIFTRFDSGGTFGAHFKLEPIENLQIHASLGTNGKWAELGNDSDAIGDIYSTGQYGIGYTISNIGFARFQFIGGKYAKGPYTYPDKAELWNRIQLAFQLTAVENLNLDFGVTIPFAVSADENYLNMRDDKGKLVSEAGKMTDDFFFSTKDDKYQAPIAIALGAKYTMGDLGLLGRVLVKLAESGTVAKVDYTGPFVFAIGIEPSYTLGDIGKVVGDVGFQVKGKSKWGDTENKDDTMDLGLGVSFHKNVGGGGNFTIGIATNIPIGGDGYNKDFGKLEAKASAFKLAIPMTITYSLY
jgi:hypothetical protein